MNQRQRIWNDLMQAGISGQHADRLRDAIDPDSPYSAIVVVPFAATCKISRGEVIRFVEEVEEGQPRGNTYCLRVGAVAPARQGRSTCIAGMIEEDSGAADWEVRFEPKRLKPPPLEGLKP